MANLVNRVEHTQWAKLGLDFVENFTAHGLCENNPPSKPFAGKAKMLRPESDTDDRWICHASVDNQ